MRRQVHSSVNYHFTMSCNYKCKFCFLNRPRGFKPIPFERAKLGLRKLREYGVRKLNFAGGEPLMHPRLLGQMVKYCKDELDFPVVQITTNARLLNETWMHDVEARRTLDMMTISIDSFDDEVSKSMGRGKGDHTIHVNRAADLCRDFDVGLKINTVVCRSNLDEDMRDAIAKLDPFRWKVVQMYLVDGMNTNVENPVHDASYLGISRDEFESFIERHKDLDCLQSEPNERFVSAYLLLNERMRFLSTSEGGKETDSILDISVADAIAQCDFSSEKFMERDGEYFDNVGIMPLATTTVAN
jgi:radical S-adenosyl methionine domain-containing protein 2